VHVTSEPISIANAAGITFLTVCCTAIAFMVWFFISLTRERVPWHAQYRLQVRVNATDWEPSQVQKTNADLRLVSVTAPIDMRRNRSSGRTAAGTAFDVPSWRGLG
jgi:hypothetical protein